MEGFSLSDLATAVRGSPGTVRVVYEGHLNIPIPSGTLNLEGTADVKSVSTGPTVRTVRDVFAAAGVLDAIKNIDDALRAKGHSAPEGYTLAITGVGGETRVPPTELSNALSSAVQDGDVIVVQGKISGR